jgi:hypothetical protein
MGSRLLVSKNKSWAGAIERVRRRQQSTPQAMMELVRTYPLPESGGRLRYENNLMHALASVEVRAVVSEHVKATLDDAGGPGAASRRCVASE